jgi:RNase adapter protein RapZ
MPLEIVLITGMSGSGKSVALHALEDAGYYCVDNLPPELLAAFVALEHQHHDNRVAIAMDVRSGKSLQLLPKALSALKKEGTTLRSLFLDATTDTLVRRFSETRRRHPLSIEDDQRARKALIQHIEVERELLAGLREESHVIDTSVIRASQLQSYVKSLMQSSQEPLTLVFQSFAFKRGIPVDADYVFDVRMLPNPHYEPGLKMLTGLDAPVQDFLQQQPEVLRMLDQIEYFLQQWLSLLIQNHRSYVTVAIGCTGGQHRSVYLAQALAQRFQQDWHAMTRHRELDGKTV